MSQGKLTEAVRAAHAGEEMASPFDKPAWIMQAAEVLRQAGEADKARAEYGRAAQAAEEALEILDRRGFQGTPLEESRLRDQLKQIQEEAARAAPER